MLNHNIPNMKCGARNMPKYGGNVTAFWPVQNDEPFCYWHHKHCRILKARLLAGVIDDDLLIFLFSSFQKLYNMLMITNTHLVQWQLVTKNILQMLLILNFFFCHFLLAFQLFVFSSFCKWKHFTTARR